MKNQILIKPPLRVSVWLHLNILARKVVPGVVSCCDIHVIPRNRHDGYVLCSVDALGNLSGRLGCHDARHGRAHDRWTEPRLVDVRLLTRTELLGRWVDAGARRIKRAVDRLGNRRVVLENVPRVFDDLGSSPLCRTLQGRICVLGPIEESSGHLVLRLGVGSLGLGHWLDVDHGRIQTLTYARIA